MFDFELSTTVLYLKGISFTESFFFVIIRQSLPLSVAPASMTIGLFFSLLLN